MRSLSKSIAVCVCALAVSHGLHAADYDPDTYDGLLPTLYFGSENSLLDQNDNILPGNNPNSASPIPGAVIQLVLAGTDGIANEPDSSGMPSGDDTLLFTTAIGVGVAAHLGEVGQFSVYFNFSDGSDRIYARIFNNSTIASSTYYGQTQVVKIDEMDGGTDKWFMVDEYGLTKTNIPRGGIVPITLAISLEGDMSAKLTFSGSGGTDYEIWYMDGDFSGFDTLSNWQVAATVTYGAEGTFIDSGDAGADGTFGTADDLRLPPWQVAKRYYRVVQAGSVGAGSPWASAEIAFYQTQTLIEGLNFIGKIGSPALLADVLDYRFLRRAIDVLTIHNGANVGYVSNGVVKKAFLLDYQGTTHWSDPTGNINVNTDPVDDGSGLIITLVPGMGSKLLPMVGLVEMDVTVNIPVTQGSYALATWPYDSEIAIADCGLIDDGFTGDVRARLSDQLYFWNEQTQRYDQPVYFFPDTGEWRYYDQTPCTKTLKPGESFLIKTTASSALTQWSVDRPYDQPTNDLNP